MSKKSLDAFLAKLDKDLGDKPLRRAVDRNKQKIRLNRKLMKMAFQEGVLAATDGQVVPTDRQLNNAVSKVFKEIKAWLELQSEKGNGIGLSAGERVTSHNLYFDLPKNSDTVWKLIRNAARSSLEAELGEELSESVFNRQVVRLHQGNTTVGSARLEAYFDALSNSRFTSFVGSAYYTKMRQLIEQYKITYYQSGKYDGYVKITLGPKSINDKKQATDFARIRADLEKDLQVWLESRDLANQKGSKSKVERVRDDIEYKIFSKFKTARNIFVFGMPKKPRKNASNYSKFMTFEKVPVGLPSPSIAKGRTKKKVIKESPSRLVALLSALLPKQVYKNMGYPALVNRTGRFASSARVTSITETREGMRQINYTYMQDPYQLFEPGRSSLATRERDPQKIISTSVRQLATQYMKDRFIVTKEL